jgi:hypothetical protein
MNLLIIGHRQHGKTDVGKLLAEALNTQAHDSSWFACVNVIFSALKERHGYATPKEAYDDRMNHRQEWFELIEAYNTVPDRLTRAILTQGTIYVGMRSRMEFEGSKQHFDHVIWVDASKRVPEEENTSMKLNENDADYVLDNNGPLSAMKDQIARLLLWLIKHMPSSHYRELVYGSRDAYSTRSLVAEMDPDHHLARGTL